MNYVLGRGITGYVGFDSYIRVLQSGAFWYSLFITCLFVSLVVPLEIVLGFLLACHRGTLQHPCPPLGWRSFSRVFANAKRLPESLWRSLRAFAHHAFKVTRTLAG